MDAVTGPQASGAGTGARPRGEDALRKAAIAFEAVFLTEMLGHAGLGRTRATLGGGAGEQAFSSMLTREYARSIAETGGTGIADRVYGTLRERVAE